MRGYHKSVRGGYHGTVYTDYEIRSGKEDQLDSLNQKEALSLSKQFDAISGEDSTIRFTYQIQEKVNKADKPISIIGEINDITFEDSNYILKIKGEFASRNFFAQIIVSKKQFEEINKQLDFKLYFYNKGCFIFKPTKIISSSLFTIDSEVSTDEDAETADEANANASSELTYDFDDVLFFFKGNMINYYLYKHLKDDED